MLQIFLFQWDGTDCPEQEPHLFDKSGILTFRRSGLRYELWVSTVYRREEKIIWAHCPFKCESVARLGNIKCWHCTWTRVENVLGVTVGPLCFLACDPCAVVEWFGDRATFHFDISEVAQLGTMGSTSVGEGARGEKEGKKNCRGTCSIFLVLFCLSGVAKKGSGMKYSTRRTILLLGGERMAIVDDWCIHVLCMTNDMSG